MSRGSRTSAGVQIGFDEIEPPLSEVTFVVVDLETTGTRAGQDEVTEIGAVRVRGGEVHAEMSTFVAIEGPLPSRITQLTGIRPHDLVDAPSPGEVMATFLEFSRGAVLVAHNARFDLAFLRALATSTGHTWPEPRHVCTLALARRVMHRGETRGHRLSELAKHLGATVEPNHRALQDARATVEILHALISRVGDCGVSTMSELAAYDGRLAPDVRRRAGLTDQLPDGPGVYVFRGAAGGALYVGSSVSVRRRARSYYSGSDPRGRMRTMVGLATSVEGVACAHMLEAWTVEEQLIDALQPPYNRRARRPRRGWWLSPGDSARSSPLVRRTPEHEHAIGPYSRSRDAQDAWADLTSATGAPPNAQAWADLVSGRDSSALRSAVSAVDTMAAAGSFERAARLRDRTARLIRLLISQQERATTAAVEEAVLVQRAQPGAWSVAIIRHGRLAAAGVVPTGASPMPVIDAIRAGATTVPRGPGPLAGATPAQVDAVHRWIDTAPTRIVSVTGEWTYPLDGATALSGWLARAEQAATHRPEKHPDGTPVSRVRA